MRTQRQSRWAAALMASENSADWYVAHRKYLAPLLERFPDGKHADQARAWVDQVEMEVTSVLAGEVWVETNDVFHCCPFVSRRCSRGLRAIVSTLTQTLSRQGRGDFKGPFLACGGGGIGIRGRSQQAGRWSEIRSSPRACGGLRALRPRRHLHAGLAVHHGAGGGRELRPCAVALPRLPPDQADRDPVADHRPWSAIHRLPDPQPPVPDPRRRDAVAADGRAAQEHRAGRR